jgi:hypothetical protein
MDEFRLNLFTDGSLIDELWTGVGGVAIVLTGAARYEISAGCDSGRQLAVLLWTSGRGTITTQVRDPGQWAISRLGADGNLQALTATNCSVHLEHMDRGHYWLGLDHSSGETMHIDLLTPGYLKTRLLTNVVPNAAN